MGAYRCSGCGINYPATYRTCKACGETNDLIGNASTDDDWKRAAFLRFYEIHDAQRHGASPDELGKREALARIAQQEEMRRRWDSLTEAYGPEPDIS